MLKLYQIYEKFLTLFKFKKKDTQTKEYLCSLFLGIRNNDYDAIEIKCILPDVSEQNINNITLVSEKYAELLLSLNSGTLRKYILDILNKNKKNSDYKTIMLVDNIINFWDVLNTIENKKQYQEYIKNQPLVKPSEAFRIK